MIVVDSGLGGLSIVRALRVAQPGLSVTYLADTGGFPYGKRAREWIDARAEALMEAFRAQGALSLAVIACNTLSTQSLAHLRARFNVPFVGTVPAIKVAAAQSATRRFTLLATPNTATGAYVDTLIHEFAEDCVVDCYGAPNLAALAEAMMLGGEVDEGALRAELIPAFHDDARGRTDTVILGCTHYPLILPALEALAPWPVGWVDPSAAIARRAISQMTAQRSGNVAYVTGEQDVARYAPVFAREGFSETKLLKL